MVAGHGITHPSRSGPPNSISSRGPESNEGNKDTGGASWSRSCRDVKAVTIVTNTKQGIYGICPLFRLSQSQKEYDLKERALSQHFKTIKLSQPRRYH